MISLTGGSGTIPQFSIEYTARLKAGGKPFGLRSMYEDFTSRLAEEGGDPSEESELKKIMVACIDTEIESLTSEENLLRTEDRQRIEYKSSAAIIPGPGILDRLLRL